MHRGNSAWYRKRLNYSDFFPRDAVWFSLISGSPAALFPLSTLFDIGIIIKRRASVKKTPALIRPINLQKVAIKKHELLLFCYWNLLGEGKKKGERSFNFIASRTLKYSLRSTFHFQPLCGRQDSWHLCMLLLFTMLFSLQICCERSVSTVGSLSYWRPPS